MTDANRSALARQVPGVRDPKSARTRSPWGYLLHTTGGGVTDLARKRGEKPIDVAIRVYIGSQNGDNGYFWGGPTYVIDHDGSIHQVAPDDALTAHAGSLNRPKYFDGSWEVKVPVAARLWRAKWGPRFKHPYELFPSTSPNTDYVGCEMIPCGDGFGTPMRPGLRFSKAQHDAAIALGVELGQRHAWPTGWGGGNRLVGHEDVDPLERSDAGGGWDPGSLRASPYFDFAYVRAGIAAAI